MSNEMRSTRVLVTAGSKHGATAEIGERIARRLTAAGLATDCIDPERVDDVAGYDAYVIGSAVYAGHWTAAAKTIASRIGGLAGRPPVWMFSSGPVGDPPKPEEDPVDVADIVATTGARDHVVFPGKIDKEQLSFGERAIMVAVRAPEGDFRNWEEIEAWADRIAEALRSDGVLAQRPTMEVT